MLAPINKTLPPRPKTEAERQYLEKINAANKPPRSNADQPITDPEKAPNGKVVHTVKTNDTLSQIAKDHKKETKDLLLVDPSLAGRPLQPGQEIMILSRERLDRLKGLRALQNDIETSDKDLAWIDGQTMNGTMRAERNSIQNARSEKVSALHNALGLEFRHAAGGKAHDAKALDASLDEMEADLKAQGFGDEESAAIIKTARSEVKTSLDQMFGPIRDDIAAAQADPTKWGDVEKKVTSELEKLAEKNPKREAAINAARETLRTFGPDDAKWRETVDAAGKTVLIDRPAAEVKSAYEKNGMDGGADAAFAKLKEVTKDLTPETAALVTQKARPTLDRAIADIGTFLDKRQKTNGPTIQISEDLKLPWDGFRVALSDFNVVGSKLSQSQASKPVLEELAGKLADAMPAVPKDHTGATTPAAYDQNELAETLRDLVHLRQEPVPGEDRVQDKQAPVLAMALVNALAEKGRTGEADVILTHVTKGIQERYETMRVEGSEALTRSGVAPAQWQSLVGDTQTDDAQRKFNEKHPELGEKLDAIGKETILLLEAMGGTPDKVKSLKGYDAFDKLRGKVSNEEVLNTSIVLSKSAWTEMGRIILESPQAGEGTDVPRAPTPYWAERSVILWTKAFQAMSASAFPESNRLTGKPFSLPPSVLNTGVALNTPAMKNLTRQDAYKALFAAVDLNSPGTLTNAADRAEARKALTEVFDKQKGPTVNNWVLKNLILGTDGTLTPRGGPSSTSAYGKGLNAVMAPLYSIGGLDLLNEANDPSVGSDKWLYQTFGVYMQVGAIRELSLLAGGLTQAQVAKGKLPTGGFLDRITRFSAVRGYKAWEWLPKQFDIFANVLLSYYAGKLYSSGDWQRGLAFTAAAGGGWIDFVATLKGSPKWSIAGLAISAAGIIADLGIKEHRRAEAAAKYEGTTREYLELAGVRPEIAKELANYDEDGNSVAPLLVQLAKERGQTPQEFLKLLNSRSGQEIKNFIDAAHHVKPDDKGRYPETKSNDIFAVGPNMVYMYSASPDATPYSNGTGYAAPWNYPESVKALAEYTRRAFK